MAATHTSAVSYSTTTSAVPSFTPTPPPDSYEISISQWNRIKDLVEKIEDECDKYNYGIAGYTLMGIAASAVFAGLAISDFISKSICYIAFLLAIIIGGTLIKFSGDGPEIIKSTKRDVQNYMDSVEEFCPKKYKNI